MLALLIYEFFRSHTIFLSWTRLQEVTAPGQEIVWHVRNPSPPNNMLIGERGWYVESVTFGQSKASLLYRRLSDIDFLI